MILVDTSVWVDHFNKSDKALSALLLEEDVVMHPLIVGELGMGNLKQRENILEALLALPKIAAASHDETLRFITHHRLFGLGIGYNDAHLLAAVRITPGSTLWTRDKRLAGVAQTLGVAFRPSA
jgi:predicted nucleic acid-binding protein